MKKYNFVLLTIFCVLFVINIYLWSQPIIRGVVSSPMTLYQIHHLSSQFFDTCEGIEYYYSGNGFDMDLEHLRSDYYKCAKADRLSSSLISLPPSILKQKNCKNLTNEKGFDCEDFSAAVVYCLAPMYDVTCDFYFTAEYNTVRNKDKYVGHAGTKCLINNTWRKID